LSVDVCEDGYEDSRRWYDATENGMSYIEQADDETLAVIGDLADSYSANWSPTKEQSTGT